MSSQVHPTCAHGAKYIHLDAPLFQSRDIRTHPAAAPRRWVRAGIDGGTTSSSNPSLRQSARGSRTADTPKLQPRPPTSPGKDKSQRKHKKTALEVCSPQPWDWAMTVDLERQLKIPHHNINVQNNVHINCICINY